MDMQEPPAFIICNGNQLAVRQDTLRELKLRNGQLADGETCLAVIHDNAARSLVDIAKEREERRVQPR